MRTEIRFAGVGGQGNILAGEWVALAAHQMGIERAQSPTYTAQVRGGPTSVDVLIDDKDIVYPRLVGIDFMLCLGAGRVGCVLQAAQPESVVVIDPNLVGKVGTGPQKIYTVPVIQITKQAVEKPVYTSAVVLGIFCRLMKVIPREAMIDVIESNAPGGTVEKNMLAFNAGWEAVDKAQPVPRDNLAPTNLEL